MFQSLVGIQWVGAIAAATVRLCVVGANDVELLRSVVFFCGRNGVEQTVEEVPHVSTGYCKILALHFLHKNYAKIDLRRPLVEHSGK